MLPASYALTVLLSTWVLASARRHCFSAPAATLWTLGTLFFPLIILPLYLVVRASRLRSDKQSGNETGADSKNPARERCKPLLLRRTLPLIYLSLMLGMGALYFYLDSKSVDAHLARANQARVRDQKERIIQEYREALKLEDDAHTHNLLGEELAVAHRWDEALAEFRTAERMGEPDDELPYSIAEALDNLQRYEEAAREYERFLTGPLCTMTPPDSRCAGVRERLKRGALGEPR